MRRLTLLAALVFASAAFAAPPPPARLALLEDESVSTSIRLAEPIERVLKDAGASAKLLDLEIVPCALSRVDARCRVPARAVMPAPDAGGEASALETESEVVLVWPTDRELARAIVKAAADPASYRTPYSIALRESSADAGAHLRADGVQTLFFQPRLSRPLGTRERETLGAYYRVRWNGRERVVLAVGRVFGGVGRTAAAGRLWAESGPWTGVARGGVLGEAGSDARGRALLEALERAGLRYSAVGPTELDGWEDLARYRAEKPDGVRFLSANLVLSSAPARTVLPAYAVFDASGTRVALIGLTSARKAPAALAARRLAVLDPLPALEGVMREVRAQADAVVVLADMWAEETARAAAVPGVDFVWGPDDPVVQLTPPPSAVFSEEERADYANPFPPLRVHHPALNRLELRRVSSGTAARWDASYSAALLDESVPEDEGFPEFQLERFATGFSTAPALLPSAAAAFPADPDRTIPAYRSREFWTIAAGLLAQRVGAEAAVLQVQPLNVVGIGEVPETYVQEWLDRTEKPVVAAVPGARLKALTEQARDQARREAARLTVDDPLRLTVSGLDAKGFVRGAPFDPAGTYRVATVPSVAAALGLGPGDPGGPGSVSDDVLAELRARAGTVPPERYGAWARGEAVEDAGLWRVNFRDIGLNVRQTKVKSSDAFAAVVNSRVQGNDELLVGGVLKTDVEYLRREYKWTNTVEAEYAKDRIVPRDGSAPITNFSSNRLMFLTLGTKRVGAVPYPWLAHSWGPSLGFQADGEFQAAPGLRRKQVYSVFPGVEFFDGSVVKTLTASGIVKRDLSREPPNTQTGLRVRTLASTPLGPAGAKFDAEVWNNYFFLTPHDVAGDLRLEGDANAKLSIPVFKHLSVAPFVDFYWFELKVRPVAGYSLMTGISVSFSRLWKPQYEPF